MSMQTQPPQALPLAALTPQDSLDLLIVTRLGGLIDAMNGYEGVKVLTSSSLSRAADLLVSARPPEALYLEDSCGSLSEIWDMARVARANGLPVLIGLTELGLSQRDDFAAAGLPVCEERSPEALAGWIATQLGLRSRVSAAGQLVLAVASAKGGIGKTTVVQLLGEAFARRGARTLIVDGDLSNSGLVPTFRVPSGFKTYMSLKEDGASSWSPDAVRRCITHHAPSGLHFLFGAEDPTMGSDLIISEWQQLMRSVRSLDEFDIVILDTGPDMTKRPYALEAASQGGVVIFPCPPGLKERNGVGNALRKFQANHMIDRCFVLYMEPEAGVTVGVKDVAPLFRKEFSGITEIGVLPRSPKIISTAAETGHYVSPLDIDSHSPLARASFQIVGTLAEVLGLQLPAQPPRSSAWQRLAGKLRGRAGRIPVAPPMEPATAGQ